MNKVCNIKFLGLFVFVFCLFGFFFSCSYFLYFRLITATGPLVNLTVMIMFNALY